MKKNSISPITRIVSFLVCTVILLSSVPFFAVAYKKATYDDIKNATTESMKEELEDLEALLAESKAALAEAENLQKSYTEKREIYLTMDALYSDTLMMLESTKLLLETEIAETEAAIEENRSEYESTYASFLDLLRMTHEQGSANYIEIILGASSLSDLLSRIERVSSMMKYSDRLLDKLKNTKAELDEQYATLSADKAEQEQAIAEFEAKEAEVLAWQAENEAALAEIESEIGALIEESDTYAERADVIDEEFQQMVSKLEAEENARRKKVEQEEAARKKAEEEEAKRKAIEAAARAQSFIWPVPNSCNHVTSPFGERMHPVYKKRMTHYGIDIGAPYGTAIYAAKDGYVSISKYHATYGYYILLNHEDGTSTIYAHCSKLLVKAGTYVKQGDTIAKVGSTGTSTGNHLHFEVRSNGVCVDPLNAVKIILPSGLYIS